VQQLLIRRKTGDIGALIWAQWPASPDQEQLPALSIRVIYDEADYERPIQRNRQEGAWIGQV